jgi:hypothetical protein
MSVRLILNFKFSNSLIIGRVLVRVDLTRYPVFINFQGLRQKSLGSLCIAGMRQIEVDGIALFINRPI